MTLTQLFKSHAGSNVAISAFSQPSLSFADLRGLIDRTVETLNGVGIGRNDRVAMVLANGPNAATAFISVAAGASAAPLNPGYTEAEFEFYLKDLKPKALIVEKDSAPDLPAILAATKLGIPVIELEPTQNTAGQFTLDTDEMPTIRPESSGYSDENDEALVLHTSGTTGTPKIVGLSLKNIMTSALQIVQDLSLSSQDKGLILPVFFHAHALIMLLSGLTGGGSVFCPPKFSARNVFKWLEESKPTWFTGVPSIHQIILLHAQKDENQRILSEHGNNIRFIRSSSAALAPAVLEELETVFRNAAVVESYGMSEAALQIAINPPDRAKRKPGTVGLPAGPEVKIMDLSSPVKFLPPGEEGEIVIRGNNIIEEYYGNAAANAESFMPGGWFRTGDIGVFDEDGYLTIVGRKSDMIIVGGENVSPVEVENVLLQHPAIAEAACFSVPHNILGEAIGSAIKLHEDQTITAPDLQRFASTKLIKFKVPKYIKFVDEIPKGPTGKLQRKDLATKLGLTEKPKRGDHHPTNATGPVHDDRQPG